MTNLAFHNDPDLQARIIAQVKEHERLDRLVQGNYYDNVTGNACFIGCVAKGSDVQIFEELTGFPVILTRIGESIFEGLGRDAFKGFPVRVITAPKCGADLSLVAWRFLAKVLEEALSLTSLKTKKACAPALEVAKAKARGEKVSAADAYAAAKAAFAAHTAAALAARATYSPHAAARATSDYARAAYAIVRALDAASAGLDAAREKQANLLIRLLQEA